MWNKAIRAVAVGAALVAMSSAPGVATAAPNEPAYAAQLRPKLEALAKDLSIPGAVVVVNSAELGNWSAGLGVRRLGGSDAPTADDQFRIGSNSKSMTSTVVLQLIEEGKLRFDDTIAQYKAGVPNGDRITIEDMMLMRTGLPSYTANPDWIKAVDANPQRVWTPDQLLALGYASPPKFAPGAQFDYSNTNTVLLGQVIEMVTGKSLADNFGDRIFAPLGMTNSLLPPSTMATIPRTHPDGYRFGTFEQSLLIWHGVLPPDQQALLTAGVLQPADVTDTNPSFAWAAGGVISTGNELARYAKALVDGGLLSADMQRRRLDKLTPVPGAPKADYRYGYNIESWGPFVGHGGDIPGFNSVMYHDPTRDLTIVAYGTLNFTPDGRQASDVLMEAVVEELYP